MMINYALIGLVVLILVVALYFYLKKNAKDKKAMGQDLNAENTTTDHHHPDKEWRKHPYSTKTWKVINKGYDRNETGDIDH